MDRRNWIELSQDADTGGAPRMTLWALLGVGSARAFGSPQAFKRMNTALACLLLVSAWLTVLV
ncbi:hypothetical protein A1D17_25210 [Pseudomonas fluorescens]|uniref:Uncharacterized protein n=1 Tax=Pseudomonas fluorescens TaxID=294 RepID=A0A166PTH0_PSEFL|nr:hypothetical protein A1D17_25210 [Pseudomonas fluorescens]